MTEAAPICQTVTMYVYTPSAIVSAVAAIWVVKYV